MTKETNIDTSNVVFIAFEDAAIKIKLPSGPWNKEPDYCSWEVSGMRCVMVRDLDLGSWIGLVGVTAEHPLYQKTLKNILDENLYQGLPKIHGGVSFAGSLPKQYSDLNKEFWFVGFETTQGNDLIPVLAQPADLKPKAGKLLPAGSTIYRSFQYVRRETNKLAAGLARLKKPISR